MTEVNEWSQRVATPRMDSLDDAERARDSTEAIERGPQGLVKAVSGERGHLQSTSSMHCRWPASSNVVAA